MNVFIALKGSHFWFLFDFTAAGVVPCGGRKTSPRTSTIVQFIFYFCPLRSAIIFWEIRKKMIGLDSYSRQVFIYLDPILIYIYQSLNWLPVWNSQNCSMFPLALPGDYRVITGSLMRLYKPKLRSMTHLPSLWMFSLLLKDLISDFYFSLYITSLHRELRLLIIDLMSVVRFI